MEIGINLSICVLFCFDNQKNIYQAHSIHGEIDTKIDIADRGEVFVNLKTMRNLSGEISSPSINLEKRK